MLTGRLIIWATAWLALFALPAWSAEEVDQAPVKILAFGDSLTHGYGLSAGDTFPEQLQAALQAAGFQAEVINGGNSGDTTAAGRARLDWSLAEQPELVIVELGANDALRGLDPAQTYSNLDAILARLEEAKIPVLLAGMQAPRNLGSEYVSAFDGVYPRLVEKYDVAYYPFFLEGVALDPKLNQRDGIHPNKDGVAEIVARILPEVTALLQGLAVQEASDG